jgi:hypothetical protein
MSGFRRQRHAVCDLIRILRGCIWPSPHPKHLCSALQVEPAELAQLEREFWVKLVHLVDWDGSGALNQEEFQRLMYAVLSPDDLSQETVASLWAQAEAASRDAGESDVGNTVLAKVLTERRQNGDFAFLRRWDLCRLICELVPDVPHEHYHTVKFSVQECTCAHDFGELTVVGASGQPGQGKH